MRLVAFEHAEALAECNVAHDVEAEVQEQLPAVDGLRQRPPYVLREELGLRVDSRLVALQCLGAEALVPDSAASLVEMGLSRGVDGVVLM